MSSAKNISQPRGADSIGKRFPPDHGALSCVQRRGENGPRILCGFRPGESLTDLHLRRAREIAERLAGATYARGTAVAVSRSAGPQMQRALDAV